MINRTEQEIMKNWKGDVNIPVVSICSITYNHEKFISEALDSFLMQETEFPFQIVIDEDCSTDGTADIIREYINQFPKLFNANFRSVNVGMQENGTNNLKRANGKYIALCEGDDYWTDPLKLQKQVDFLEENEEYNMVFHNAEIQDHLFDGSLRVNQFNKEKKNSDYSADQIIGKHSVSTASVVFKNLGQYEYLNDNPWFPYGDTPLFVTCASLGKIYYMADAMSVYRRVQSGMMNSPAFHSTESKINAIKLHKKLYFDYKNILNKKIIDKHIAIIYQTLSILEKEKGQKIQYLTFLFFSFKHDPKYILNLYSKRLLVKLKFVTNIGK